MKHNILKSAVVFLLLAAMGLGAMAQTAQTITLKEAIDRSVANSHALKNNTAKIAEAAAAVAAAKERQLPDASISGSYTYLPVTPTINLKSDTAGGGGPKVSQAIYGIASVSLPIYTGGKIKYGIQSAQYLLQASQLDADQNKEAVIFNSIQAYSNLYKAKATVGLIKENLAQSNQRVKDFANLEKNGLLARNELLKAQLQASNVSLTLLDAESNYQLASVNMALMLGLPEQTLLLADSASFQTANKTLKTIDEYEQLALQGRKDAGALALRKKVAELGIKTAKADGYPTIALSAGYVAADLPGFLSIYNAVNVGVGIKYNIASLWKSKSSVAAAKARVQQVSASEDQLNDHIRLQINQAFQAYQLSLKKIEVYKLAVEQAKENYRITKNKFDNALATTTEVLDADVAQLQTQINVSNAAADAVVAYNQLLQVAGLLNNN